jgi:hypothetical protein
VSPAEGGMTHPAFRGESAERKMRMTASPSPMPCRGTGVSPVEVHEQDAHATPVEVHGQDAHATWRRCPAKRGVCLRVLWPLCGSTLSAP